MRKRGYVIKNEAEIKKMPPFPFPICAKEIKGWQETNCFFVDKTGWDNHGYAMPVSEFIKELKVGRMYGITDEGQFQVYVTEWEKERK